jgi:hypothetical protein
MQKRVIPIQGVSIDAMSILRYDLLDIPGILEILEHKQTHTHGRWSIMTTKDIFRMAIKQVNNLLHFSEYSDNVDIDFPPSSLAFNTRQKFPVHTPHRSQSNHATSPNLQPSQHPTPPILLSPPSSSPSNPFHHNVLKSRYFTHDFRISHWENPHISSSTFLPKPTPTVAQSSPSTSPLGSSLPATKLDVFNKPTPMKAFHPDHRHLHQKLAQLSEQVQSLLAQMDEIRQALAGDPRNP